MSSQMERKRQMHGLCAKALFESAGPSELTKPNNGGRTEQHELFNCAMESQHPIDADLKLS